MSGSPELKEIPLPDGVDDMCERCFSLQESFPCYIRCVFSIAGNPEHESWPGGVSSVGASLFSECQLIDSIYYKTQLDKA